MRNQLTRRSGFVPRVWSDQGNIRERASSRSKCDAGGHDSRPHARTRVMSSCIKQVMASCIKQARQAAHELGAS